MKTDKQLGLKVRDLLIEKNIETPMRKDFEASDESRNEILKSFTNIMHHLGLDLDNDSLKESPYRVTEMFLEEQFKGLDYANFPKCTTIENNVSYHDIVIEKNITSISVCEHHFVTIDGFAHVGYIPNKKIVGLSKLNRVVDFFSARPQVQERLTRQIFESLKFILETDDVAVVLEAKHYCVKGRGIRDHNSSTITSAMGGAFMNESACRKEFMDLVRR
jgi:GTP cyclohydrolase I